MGGVVCRESEGIYVFWAGGGAGRLNSAAASERKRQVGYGRPLACSGETHTSRHACCAARKRPYMQFRVASVESVTIAGRNNVPMHRIQVWFSGAVFTLKFRRPEGVNQPRLAGRPALVH